MVEVLDSVSEFLQPLLLALPIHLAMPNLLPSGPASAEAVEIALQLEPTLPSASLRAGLWLYVDDLDRSHTISQSIETPTGSFWHGILHRREGDFSNSKYWFRRAGKAPFSLPGYDPLTFVDRVSQARGEDPDELVERQRAEWAALFAYCATESVARSQ